MRAAGGASERYGASVLRRRGFVSGAAAAGAYEVLCRRPDGSVRWHERTPNLVVNAGLDYLLDVALSGGTPITTWYLGLLAASPSPLATWTATEVAANDFVAYSEATLQTWIDGGVSSQLVTNSASKASFSINADSSSIGGAFLISTNAKATPAGTLYSAGAFTGGNKAADNGDTLEVTWDGTMAAV